MESLQLQEGAIAVEMLGDVDKQVKLPGDVDKQVKVSDVVDGQVHHFVHEGDEVHYSDDVGEQRHKWDAMDENKQIWDAVDEQRKLKKLEEKKKKKQQEMSQEKKKKKTMDLEVQRKELKRKPKTTRGRGSPSVKHLNQRVTSCPYVRSPLARSPRLNMSRSSLGVLAEVAASKRGRSSHGVTPEEAESSPLSKRAKPSVSTTPSPTSLPSPTSSPVGSPRKSTRGRKTRRLTSTVWKDFKPIYRREKLVKAQCNHCDEILPAGQGVGTSGVRRHLDTCRVRSDLNLIVQKLKSSVVPSESAFSTGHRVVSDYRSRLDITTVEALICLQDWFKNHCSLADIVEENDL